jgi:type II secretion system protein D
MPGTQGTSRTWALRCAAVALGFALIVACVGHAQAPSAGPSFGAAAAPTDGAGFRAYQLQHLDANTACNQLTELLRGSGNSEVVADQAQNRLLIRGDAQTQQLVEQFLLKLDRAQVPASAPAGGQSKMESYALNEATRDVLAAWQAKAAQRPDVRVALDERTSQALVFAPPGVHAQIQQELGARNIATAPAQAPGLVTPAGPVILQLKNLPPVEVHARIERLLARPLPASVDVSGQWQSFTVEISPGVVVAMNVNTRSGQVRIDGPPLQVAAWRKVVEALDSPPAAAGNVTQLVATRPANQERVRKALAVLQKDSESREATGSLMAMLFQPQDADPNAAAQPAPANQPAAPNQPAQPAQPPAAAPTADTAQRAIELAEAAGGLLGPVKVEFVEGTDFIVLRGNERDVQRVLNIINEIEQLSTITVPTIEIYELKSVDSVSMGNLLQRLYAQVLEPRIGAVSITPLAKPNALLLIGREENVKMAIELVKRLDQPVSPTSRFEVFPLRHANAAEAKALIDGFLGQTQEQQQQQQQQAAPGVPPGQEVPTLAPRALVVADARTNSLIVSASPRDLAEVAALVARIDTPGAAAQLKVFTIVNGDAETLAQMLRSLFSVPAAADAAQAGGGGLSAGPVRMQFSVDPRTNSIIAAGTAEDLAVVEAILLRLDQGDLRERVTTVHRLNNAYALNVAQALDQWLQTERQAEEQADLAISPFEAIEREVIVVPEIATNSLIVSATPRFYKEVLQVIADLDERPPMVLIQVLIAEVRLSDTDQFGVELGLQDSLLFDRSLLGTLTTVQTTTETQSPGGAVTTTTQDTIVNAPGNPGFNFNDPATGVPLPNNLSDRARVGAGTVAAQGLSNFAVNRLDPALGFSGFVLSASSDAVSVLLRALQEKRRVEVLSRPQLMALDGQPGQVQVGQDVPTVTGVSLNQFGQTNNIIYRSVGLILQVRPRISPDGLVVMEIFANKSEVGPESEGIPISFSTTGVPLRAPRFEVSAAQTTVSALSGQTVILGGLIQNRKNDVHRRVPIIADIPLIGDLFRYDSVFEERRELLIILTPQIIYNKLDSDLVKQIESSRMSWILSDVVNIHGEAGLRSRCDEWAEGEMESIFPTDVPEEGVLPLSKGQLESGAEGPFINGPGCEPQVEIYTPERAVEPVPEPRTSPSAARPANDRYGLTTNSAISQAVNIQPAEVPRSSSTLQLGAFHSTDQ